MGEEDFLGAISAFGGTFAPINYALCQGQTIQIQQYTALYAIIGGTWTMNQSSQTFTLPNLTGATMIGAGNQQAPWFTPPAGPNTPLGAQGVVNAMPGAAAVGTVGVNFAIAMNGIFPSRP